MKNIALILFGALLSYLGQSFLGKDPKNQESSVSSSKDLSSLATAERGQNPPSNLPSLLRSVSSDLREKAFAKNETEITRLVLRELIADSPAQAAELISRIEDENFRHEMMGELTHQWSQKNAKAAYDWLTKSTHLFNEQAVKDNLASIFHDLVGQDMELANQLAKQHNDPLFQEMVIRSTAMKMGSEDLKTATEWLTSLQSVDTAPDLLEASYLLVMQKQAQKDPTTAATLIEQLKSPILQQQLTEAVILPLFKDDPAAAIDWVEKLNFTESQSSALNSLAQNLEAEAVFTVFQDLASKPDLKIVGENIAKKALSHDPLRGAALVAKLDDATRAHYVPILATEWADQAPEEAKAWVQSLQSKEEFDHASSAVAQHMINHTPNEALQWGAGITNPEERSKTFLLLAESVDPLHVSSYERALNAIDINPEIRSKIERTLSEKLERFAPTIILPSSN